MAVLQEVGEGGLSSWGIPTNTQSAEAGSETAEKKGKRKRSKGKKKKQEADDEGSEEEETVVLQSV